MGWSRDERITKLDGHVLADDAPMQDFMRKPGFTLSRSLDDADIIPAKKAL